MLLCVAAPFEEPEIFRVPLDQLYLKIESSIDSISKSNSGGGGASSKEAPKPAKVRGLYY